MALPKESEAMETVWPEIDWIRLLKDERKTTGKAPLKEDSMFQLHFQADSQEYPSEWLEGFVQRKAVDEFGNR